MPDTEYFQSVDDYNHWLKKVSTKRISCISVGEFCNVYEVVLHNAPTVHCYVTN